VLVVSPDLIELQPIDTLEDQGGLNVSVGYDVADPEGWDDLFVKVSVPVGRDRKGQGAPSQS
jgi:hypothetical protein